MHLTHTGPRNTFPRDCRQAYQRGCREDGVYTIDPGCGKPFQVYCCMKNGGWIVIQRRRDGSEDFYRGWEDYVTGFGNLRGEFWLGLEHIHCLTSVCPKTELRVELADFEGNCKYAHYSFFSVGNSGTNYTLNIAGYTGTAGDSIIPHHNGMQFSTRDRDNDKWSSANCAIRYKGAWWYMSCYHSNPNGLYLSGQHVARGVTWNTFHSGGLSLKFTQMKLRFRD